MSGPLFKTEGSVWRTAKSEDREPDEEDEEDEDWVDRSLPSSPLDRTFQDPFEAGPSKLRNREPRLPPLPDEDDDDLETKPNMEDVKDRNSTPLGEIDPDEDDLQPEDERQCRICFSGREEEDTLGRLISPCLCTGSVRVSAHRRIRRIGADTVVCSRYVKNSVWNQDADRQWTVSTPGEGLVRIR
jgi:hypothetical protein